MTANDLAMAASVTAFAVAIGANNGATLVALGLRAPRPRPWLLVVILSMLVATGPVIFGTHVASTMANQLVDVDPSSRSATVVATSGAVFATLALAGTRGLPTSSFIATIWALAGAGLGASRAVHWWVLVAISGVAMTAPVVGLVVAYVLTRLRPRIGVAPTRHASVSSLLAFVLLALAYSAGGAQVVLAMFALTTGSTRAAVNTPRLLVVGACFLVGTLIGLRRIAGSIGSGVMPVRPRQAARVELASAVTMGAIAAVGLPVSV